MDERPGSSGISFGNRESVHFVYSSKSVHVPDDDKDIEEMNGSGSGSNSSDVSLAEQLKRCRTQNSVYLTLSKKLRAHQVYGVGDLRLYTSMTDASRYIQQMCEKNPEAQDSMRASGLLNTVVEAFVFFFQKHLEDQVNPLSQDSLVKCWSNICTALISAVGNPTHRLNQEHVLGKLIEKHDLMSIRFVDISSKSVEKKTEKYVLPLVQLFRTLLIDNHVVQSLVSSRDYFVTSVAEGMRSRLLIMCKHDDDQVTWKSIDFMAYILYMVFQEDMSDESAEREDSAELLSVSRKAATTNTVLAELILPCLSFLEKNSDSERPQSIGVISLLALILGRNLESAQCFIKNKGEVILAQILSSDPQSTVQKAAEFVFKVLKVQKKKMRGNGMENYLGDDKGSQSNFSVTASDFQRVTQTTPSPSRICKAVNKATTTKPVVLTSENTAHGIVRSWIEKSPFNVDVAGQGSRSSSDDSSFLPVPTTSEVGTSVSQYRGYNGALNLTPRFLTDQCCPTCTKPGCHFTTPKPTPTADETEGGCGRCVNGDRIFINPTLPNRRQAPCRRSMSLDQVSDTTFRTPPTPIQRKRKSSTASQNRDLDRESCVSIKIPRGKVNSGSRTENVSETSNGKENESLMSETNLLKILSDLRPCEVMENDDHVVIFLSQAPQANDQIENSETDIMNNCPASGKRQSYEAVKNCRKPGKPLTRRKEQEGYIGKFFHWMFG